MPALVTRRLVLGSSLLLPGLVGRAEAGDFDSWLAELRRDAAAAGVGRATLDRALKGLRPIEEVVELDRRQPETRLTFAEYRRKVISESRINRGIERLRQHRPLLEQVSRRYGVAPATIVALWGLESSYGEFKGRFPVVGSLATLAWEGRRAAFFRKELIAALKILDRGDISPEGMYGSWAGAMGQCQFMPSTYLGYAADFDGDGRRDIWQSLPDVFASIANYLDRAGWDGGEIWGREVTLPRSLDRRHVGLGTRATLAEWRARGVRRADGSPLPDAALEASLVETDDGAGPAFLVYNNFRTIMVWNRSTYFALSVGLLADELGAGAAS